MIRSAALAVCALLLCIAPDARADGLVVGVAAQCDARAGTFKLLPIADTDEVATSVAAPANARRLPNGEGQVVKCALGKTHVRALVDVYPPQERGEGQGAGVIELNELWIDGLRVLSVRRDFNWGSGRERQLTEVVVARGAKGAVVTLCDSDGFDWDQTYANKRCSPYLGFAGKWSADKRTREQRARGTDCGVAYLDLQQVGDALRGTFDYATVGCGRVEEEAEVRGSVSGEEAEVSIKSARNNAVVQGTMSLMDGQLIWRTKKHVVAGEPQGDDLIPEFALFSREDQATP